MKPLKLQFVHCYFDCNNFKQKEIAVLDNLLKGSRLNDDMRITGYGTISFAEDDLPRRYPTITTEDADGNPLPYNRRGTNCLVIDLMKTDKNPGIFDKLFLYHTCRNSNGVWYGYLAYNTKTGKSRHRFFIDHTHYDLTCDFAKFLYGINRCELYDKLLAESIELSRPRKAS